MAKVRFTWQWLALLVLPLLAAAPTYAAPDASAIGGSRIILCGETVDSYDPAAFLPGEVSPLMLENCKEGTTPCKPQCCRCCNPDTEVCCVTTCVTSCIIVECPTCSPNAT